MDAQTKPRKSVGPKDAAQKPSGFHTIARELQACTFEGPRRIKNTTKFRKHLQEREERKLWREREKSEFLGGPEEGVQRPVVWRRVVQGSDNNHNNHNHNNTNTQEVEWRPNPEQVWPQRGW